MTDATRKDEPVPTAPGESHKWEPNMNPTQTADKSQTPMTRDEVKKLLRDAAFVLHMTRKVKAEMMADRPEAAKAAERKNSQEMTAGLGV
jgi:hypothetical protein